MRDPNRIGPMIATLKEIWEAHPDLRLGQLIIGASMATDPFYMEDDEMAERLEVAKNEWKSVGRG